MSEHHSDAAASALRRATAGGRPRSATAKKTPSRARRVGRDPLLLGDAVENLITERGWQQSSTAARLSTEWPSIVGPEVADHVNVESFTEGRLLLRAESTSWATQVRLLLPNLRTAIDAALGSGVIVDISVVGPQAPSWVAGPRRVKGRGPRDTYG